jgi:hypothetical protein
MVTPLISEPTALDADVEPADGTDLSVEPVEHVAGAEPGCGCGCGGTCLHRVRLELQVAALEAALDRARRRRELVVNHYERVLEGREGGESPAFSWRG